MSSWIDFRAVAEKSLEDQPSLNLYFLLDHGGLPGLHGRLVKCAARWLSLFDGTREQNALSVAPVLVLVASNGKLCVSRLFFDWISKHGTYTSSVIMLASPQPIEVLKERLSARLDVQLSEDMEAMLRFFDPRVFEKLTTTLSAEQAEQFFGVAHWWSYVDRAGELTRFPAKFRADENFVPHLLLTQQQESDLIDSCEADQVLNLLRGTVPELLNKIRLQDQYEFVLRQIVAAKRENLDSVTKFSVYAMFILLKGESVVNDASWENLLQRIKNGNFYSLDEEVGDD